VQPSDTSLAEQTSSSGSVFRLRNWTHTWGSRTLLMGIVNITPDSFSGDGIMSPVDAVQLAVDHLDNGADIVDLGGESTRPGHKPVSEETELQRVLPVVQALRRRCPEAIFSIDTTKPEVLKRAVAAGADILNSIWGLRPELLSCVAELRVPVVIMHNKETAEYDRQGVVDHVVRYLEDHAEKALRAGIPREHIMLDPGIGFGKTAEHNLQVLHNLHRIVALGYPTLIGVSRKSFIGKLTEKTADNRAFGTAAAVSIAIASGIDIVRVHDVKEMKDVIVTADAVARGWRPPLWEVDFDSSDCVSIEMIQTSGRHGVTDEERAAPQPFEIEISLKVNLQAPEKSDAIEDTVNYSTVRKQVSHIVETHSYKLLERLAGAIMESLFQDKRITAARVRIGKPGKLKGATPRVSLVRKNPGV
jgi:dihydropteroate synthase